MPSRRRSRTAATSSGRTTSNNHHRSSEIESSSSISSHGCNTSTSSHSHSNTSNRSALSHGSARSNNSPLAMAAASARDKLQASARELFKNLEDALLSTTTTTSNGGTTPTDPHPSSSSNGVAAASATANLESALRSMFSSCTTGAESNTVHEATKVVANASAVSAGVSSPPLPSPSVNGGGSSPRASRKNTKDATALFSSSPSPMLMNLNKHTTTNSSNNNNDLGEHIYAQLFFDDQIRAAKAVNAVRGTTEVPAPSPTATGTTNHPGVTSTPIISPLVSPFHATPSPPTMTATELDISRNLTFDDSISAISAHTLEAMAATAGATNNGAKSPSGGRMMRFSPSNLNHQNSNDSTLFPPESLLASENAAPQPHQRTSPPRTLGASPSPFFSKSSTKKSSTPSPQIIAAPPTSSSFTPPALQQQQQSQTINLSFQRSNSNNSKHSKHSHSTRTTESSSFDHWQQEDNKFWVHEAQKDDEYNGLERQPPPSSSSQSKSSSKSSSRKSKTSSSRKTSKLPPTSPLSHTAKKSSSTTNPRSPHRHPHDTGLYSSSLALTEEDLYHQAVNDDNDWYGNMPSSWGMGVSNTRHSSSHHRRPMHSHEVSEI